jgi:hypothetical protein
MFWFQRFFQAKTSTPVKPTPSVRRVGEITSAEDGSWSSTANMQAVCDRLN